MKQLTKINDAQEVKNIVLDKKEQELVKFLTKRIEVLKKTKTDIGGGFDFEQLMRDADREYLPNNLLQKNKEDKDKNLVYLQDEETGLRGTSRIVNLDNPEGSWRSNLSEPTLLVKVQTALSILIDQNPEATFKGANEKYEKRNNVAKAIWKRNWSLNNSIETLKLFVFDLAKYGFAVGHTVPRILKRDKEILESVDTEHPENNKYRKTTITEFNDVYREKLDLYRTWIDDKANLTDPFSINDWYYEKDYSLEDFQEEFGMYANSQSIKAGTLVQEGNSGVTGVNSATKTRDDMITVGFYENKKKDLYSIYIADKQIPLYYSPLPNDEGKLTLWYAYWIERDPRTIYGIGLFELIKNNKVMYDRLKNMTVDQLVMAIYPMLFYSGTPAQGEAELTIRPDKLVQKLSGSSIEQVKIQFDPRGRDGIDMESESMDNNTGITPTLGGEVTGKTLGEILHAKDAALKRLNIPMLNISKAIEMDAYITLSWANQIYSIPEIKKFLTEKEMQEYEEESGNKAENATSQGDTENGQPAGKIEAQYYPKLDLGLDEDKEGVLIESPERRFFQLGSKDGQLGLGDLKWEGKIVVKAQSIISPNPEIERQRKMELFNVVSPVVYQMSALMNQQVDPKTGQMFTPKGGMEVAMDLYYPVKQILDIQDEKPENWLPKKLCEMADNPEAMQQAQDKQAQEEEQTKLKAEQEANAAKPLLTDQAGLDQQAKDSGAGAPPVAGGQAGMPGGGPVVAPSSLPSPVADMMSAVKGGNTSAMNK
jgi:hypothetical protein